MATTVESLGDDLEQTTLNEDDYKVYYFSGSIQRKNGVYDWEMIGKVLGPSWLKHREIVEKIFDIIDGNPIEALNTTPLYVAIRDCGLADKSIPVEEEEYPALREVAKELIAAGADPNMMDDIGCTVLRMAVEGNLEDIVASLLAAGASLFGPHDGIEHDGTEYEGKDTLLHMAARQNCTKSAKHLIAAGADVNAQDKENYTPLYYALKRGHVEFAKMLTDAGAQYVDPDQDFPSEY